MALIVTLGLLFLGIDMGSAQQAKEKFPNRPITLIVNYAAGGLTDLIVRPMAKAAEKELGVPIIIENKAGGSGAVGLTQLAKSKPDGYNIGSITIGAMVVVPLMQKVEYDPFKDFEYICGFGRNIYGIWVRTDKPWKSIKDVVDAARKEPDKITYGSMSASIGIALKFVELKENLKMIFIPQQSSQETTTSLIGGHTDLGVCGPDAVAGFLKSGEIRLLAAVTPERWSDLPNVPTMKEQGYDIDITGWTGLGAPAGIPKDRLDIIYQAVQRAHSDPEAKAILDKLKFTAPYISGDELRKNYMARSTAWKPLLDAMKTTPAKK